MDGLEPGQYSFQAYAIGEPMLHGWTLVDVPAEGSIEVSIELEERER